MLGCLFSLKSDVNGSVWVHPALDGEWTWSVANACRGPASKIFGTKKCSVQMGDDTDWQCHAVTGLASDPKASSCLAIPCFTLGMGGNVLHLPEKGILPSAAGVRGRSLEESAGWTGLILLHFKWQKAALDPMWQNVPVNYCVAYQTACCCNKIFITNHFVKWNMFFRAPFIINKPCSS